MASTVRKLSRIGTWSDSMQRIFARWAATLAELVGVRILQTLTEFSRSAGPGSMITIKRTGDGFTAQVTGPIVKGTPEPLTMDSLTLFLEGMD